MTDFSAIKSIAGITESCGYTQNEIDAAICCIGALPQTLIDYYLQLGNNELINQSYHNLCFPHELSVENGHVVFFTENQVVCEWAILEADLTKSNPPVYVTTDSNAWKKETDNLYDFLCSMAHMQAIMASKHRFSGCCLIDKNIADEIKKNYQRKPFCPTIWMGIELFGNEDNYAIALISYEDSYSLAYASSSQEQFEVLDNSLSVIRNTKLEES